MKRPVLLLSVLLGLSGLTQAAGINTAGIDHVGINVPDLKQAETFFHDTFGCVPATQIGPFELDKLPSPDGKPLAGSVTIAMIRCGSGANIELFAYKDANGNTQMPAMQDSGASHIAFYTDDIQGGVAYLKSKGIAISGEPITMTSGDTAGESWVHFRAPWGADLELVSYPHGKAYEKHASVKLWNPAQPTR